MMLHKFSDEENTSFSRRHLGENMDWRRIVAHTKIQHLTVCAVAIGIILLNSDGAAGWGDRAHLRIAESALKHLPDSYRDQIISCKKDLLSGITEDPSEITRTGNYGTASTLDSDIRLLIFLSRSRADRSHYLAYFMGVVARHLADRALPFACSQDSANAKLQEVFERDIDSKVKTIRIENISTAPIDSHSEYLGGISRKAELLESKVVQAYASGDGYEDCWIPVVVPSLQQATEAVTRVWLTILLDEPAPMAVRAHEKRNYSVDQLRYSSKNKYMDDIEALLSAVEGERERITITPKVIGNDFFSFSCNDQTKRIYDLAVRVGIQSSSLSERKRACDEYASLHPQSEFQKAFPRRDIPDSAFGRGGKPPKVYVYLNEKTGGLLFTSKVKESRSDLVPINFKPIREFKGREPGQIDRESKGGDVGQIDLEEIIRYYARDYGVEVALIKAVIKAESDYDPYVVSHAGARGLMQLMPPTAMEMGVKDIFDPSQNVAGGTQYLSHMLKLFGSDKRLALAAYNAGPGNVKRYKGIPPFEETQNYVPKVLGYYEKYKDDSTPVSLRKVARARKPMNGYLPKAGAVGYGKHTIVKLKNGNTMRGTGYKKMPDGVQLKLGRSWIFIRNDLISEII